MQRRLSLDIPRSFPEESAGNVYEVTARLFIVDKYSKQLELVHGIQTSPTSSKSGCFMNNLNDNLNFYTLGPGIWGVIPDPIE